MVLCRLFRSGETAQACPGRWGRAAQAALAGAGRSAVPDAGRGTRRWQGRDAADDRWYGRDARGRVLGGDDRSQFEDPDAIGCDRPLSGMARGEPVRGAALTLVGRGRWDRPDLNLDRKSKRLNSSP